MKTSICRDGALKNQPNYPAYPALLMHYTVSPYRLSDHNNIYMLLGTRIRIRCLTRSTWKDRNGEAWSAGETTPCCPPPIHSRVSEWSKLLGWWRASRFLSLLSCCLSSFCWAVNRLPYIWTRSGVVFYLLSPWPRSPYHHTMASWRAKRYINYA